MRLALRAKAKIGSSCDLIDEKADDVRPRGNIKLRVVEPVKC